MRHPLCWLLLLMAISAASEAGHADLYFSAPYSGQKVTEYEVNLPISRHIKKPFRIPADCAAAQAAFR
ncbi:ferric uptake regulator family protein, partial [Candidatus Endoriftia persephone str. Guaymas]|nr:ferric uptake regulator family protein [Candidatus Endoriftia persephone str. Guaymas]